MMRLGDGFSGPGPAPWVWRVQSQDLTSGSRPEMLGPILTPPGAAFFVDKVSKGHQVHPFLGIQKGMRRGRFLRPTMAICFGDSEHEASQNDPQDLHSFLGGPRARI